MNPCMGASVPAVLLDPKSYFLNLSSSSASIHYSDEETKTIGVNLDAPKATAPLVIHLYEAAWLHDCDSHFHFHPVARQDKRVVARHRSDATKYGTNDAQR